MGGGICIWISDLSEARVTGDCELPDVDARNWTRVLRKNDTCWDNLWQTHSPLGVKLFSVTTSQFEAARTWGPRAKPKSGVGSRAETHSSLTLGGPGSTCAWRSSAWRKAANSKWMSFLNYCSSNRPYYSLSCWFHGSLTCYMLELHWCDGYTGLLGTQPS